MNTVAEIRRHQMAEIRTQLEQPKMLDEFAKALPKQIPPERFVRVALTAIQNSPDLLDCEKRSVFNACMRCATDGLVPDGREAALVVFKDKRRGLIASYIPMIAGIRKKIRQSGEIVTFEAHVVHEKDDFDYELGDEPFIRHRPARGERGSITAAYSVATFRTGEKSREVMSIDEIHKVRQVSRAERGPWQDWFSEMCRKTVAKRHAKQLPTSSELEQLFARDREAELEAEQDAAAPERLPPRSFAAALDHLAGPEFMDEAPADIGPEIQPDPHQPTEQENQQ